MSCRNWVLDWLRLAGYVFVAALCLFVLWSIGSDLAVAGARRRPLVAACGPREVLGATGVRACRLSDGTRCAVTDGGGISCDWTPPPAEGSR